MVVGVVMLMRWYGGGLGVVMLRRWYGGGCGYVYQNTSWSALRHKRGLWY